MKTRSLSRSLAIAIALALALAGCAKNPVTGKRQFTLISESQEIAIGQQSHPEVLAEYGEVDDPALQSYIDGVGQTMARQSERPDLPWHFTVVDTPVVNAFALPGGYIYITREILSYMNNEAELAGVLGHEIGHVTARHSVSQVSKAQLVGLGLGLGGVFSNTFRNLSDFAELGAGLLFLKYGRDAERQADQLGVRYMFEQGWDPRQVSRFFEVFQTMREKSGESLPNWLSSHPAPPDRVEATLAQAEQLMAGRDGQVKVNRDDFLRRLDNLVFGDNPREGFTEEGRFLHPDLRFQLAYPNGWQVQNTKSSVVFEQPGGEAAIQLTLGPPDTSPESRARAIAERQGVEWVGGGGLSINGNPAYRAYYRLLDAASGAELNAVAAFVSYRGNLYELVGMSPPQSFRQHAPAMESAIGSFAELRDSRALAVQPDRLRVQQIQRGGTLRDLARQYPNPRVGVDELATLNRIGPDEPLERGRLVKVVQSGRK